MINFKTEKFTGCQKCTKLINISSWLLVLFYSFFNNNNHNRFTALFPGPPGWDGARRELLDFMVQGKINRGRHTDHPAWRHSIQTNQCLPPPSHLPFFYRPDALLNAQPTASKHWRQPSAITNGTKTIKQVKRQYMQTHKQWSCWQFPDCKAISMLFP